MSHLSLIPTYGKAIYALRKPLVFLGAPVLLQALITAIPVDNIGIVLAA